MQLIVSMLFTVCDRVETNNVTIQLQAVRVNLCPERSGSHD